MGLNERILAFISHLEVNVAEFERNCNLSNGSVSKMGDNTRRSTLEKISKIYPSLNLNWLLTGEGSMILGEENATQQKQEGLRHGRFIRVTTHHVQDEENVNYINIDNITSFHLKEGSILINTCDGKRHKITDNVSELFEALL